MSTVEQILTEVHEELVNHPQPLCEVGPEPKEKKSRLPTRVLHGVTVRHGTPGNRNLEKQRKPSWLIGQRDKMLVMLDQLIRQGKAQITQHDHDTSQWYRALNDLGHMICHNNWLFTHKGTHQLRARWNVENISSDGTHRTLTVFVHWSNADKMNVPKVQAAGLEALDFYKNKVPLSIRILEICALGYGVEEPETITKFDTQR